MRLMKYVTAFSTKEGTCFTDAPCIAGNLCKSTVG